MNASSEYFQIVHSYQASPELGQRYEAYHYEELRSIRVVVARAVNVAVTLERENVAHIRADVRGFPRNAENLLLIFLHSLQGIRSQEYTQRLFLCTLEQAGGRAIAFLRQRCTGSPAPLSLS